MSTQQGIEARSSGGREPPEQRAGIPWGRVGAASGCTHPSLGRITPELPGPTGPGANADQKRILKRPSTGRPVYDPAALGLSRALETWTRRRSRRTSCNRIDIRSGEQARRTFAATNLVLPSASIRGRTSPVNMAGGADLGVSGHRDAYRRATASVAARSPVARVAPILSLYGSRFGYLSAPRKRTPIEAIGSPPIRTRDRSRRRPAAAMVRVLRKGNRRPCATPCSRTFSQPHDLHNLAFLDSHVRGTRPSATFGHQPRYRGASGENGRLPLGWPCRSRAAMPHPKDSPFALRENSPYAPSLTSMISSATSPCASRCTRSAASMLGA